MDDIEIKKYLHMVIAQKTEDVIKIQERIGILSHQIESWDRMLNSVKRAVINDLVDDLKYYGWKEELQKSQKIFDELE